MLEFAFLVVFLAIVWWAGSRRSAIPLRLRLEVFATVLAILLAAAYVIIKRFELGLGAVSHMSDQFPWGIWIGFDLCGVALAAGGFVLAGTVHVLHLKRFEPILRPTVLTALIAYQLVAAILVLDLGRPYRFWHPLIMWQPHSVMFEITFCLTLYTLVLALEFSPILGERFGWKKMSSAIHSFTLPVVMLGVILSTLHQSSFGSLFLIMPQKLHPLWYTPWLPVLFFTSAVCAGIAVVTIESHFCEKWFHHGFSDDLMRRLGRACGVVLCLYVGLKLADLWSRGAWRYLSSGSWLAFSWLAEVGMGAALPAVWLCRPHPATPTKGILVASFLITGGVVLNRLNVCWFGLIPASGVVYVPSWMEVVLTLAFVVLGIFAFMALSQLLPVFPVAERPREIP